MLKIPNLKVNWNAKTETVETSKEEEEVKTEEPKEEWIWVDGYKGTESNLTCRGFQFELGKQYDMAEDAKIKICDCGFHLCLKLDDVFHYYAREDGNRFFEVKALVRANEVNNYRSFPTSTYYMSFGYTNKLSAKSIILTRELTADEILKGTDAANWPEEYKKLALVKGVEQAGRLMRKPQLLEMGYSETFVEWLVNIGSKDRLEMALTVGSQPDLSMDVKVLSIMMR